MIIYRNSSNFSVLMEGVIGSRIGRYTCTVKGYTKRAITGIFSYTKCRHRFRVLVKVSWLVIYG